MNDTIIYIERIKKDVTLQSQTCVDKNFVLTAIIPIASDLHDLTNLKKTLVLAHNSLVKLILIIDLKENQYADNFQELLNNVCTYCVKYKLGFFKGPGDARNAAFELVNTKWVVFWDSDDIPNPGAIVKAIESNKNSDVIIGSYLSTNFHSGVTKDIVKHSKNIISVIWCPGIWRIVMKFKIITQPFPQYKMGEDQIFILKNKILNRPIFFEKAVFYNYFTNVPNQLTSKKNMLSELIKVFIESLEFSNDLDYKTKVVVLSFCARQFLTIQRRCTWKLKFSSCVVVLKYILGMRLSRVKN